MENLRQLQDDLDVYAFKLKTFWRGHGLLNSSLGHPDHVAIKAADKAGFKSMIRNFLLKTGQKKNMIILIYCPPCYLPMLLPARPIFV